MATQRVIKNNKQRDKTPAQKTREALVLEEVSREIGKNGQGERTDLRPNWDESDFRWDEDVAEQIGVSKNSVRRGTDVFRMAYPEKYVDEEYHDVEKYDVSDEVREVARQQVEQMDADEQSH